MFEEIISWDKTILQWVLDHRHAWLDGPMYVLSHLKYFLPLLIPGGVIMFWKGGYKWRRAIIVALFLVLVTDQLSASILKPLIGRARPFSSSFSFPSSHATNIFAQAIYWSCFYPVVRIWLVLFAVLVGISRVYLAKHFPLDVLGGALIGGLCGYLLYWLLKRWGEHPDWTD